MNKSLFTYFIECCTKNFINYQGRARKKEYWGFILFQIPVTIALFILSLFPVLSKIVPLLFIICYIVLLPAFVSLTIRRLHDADHSGWCALYLVLGIIIPFVTPIGTVVIGLLKGTAGTNRFGQDPLQISPLIPSQTE